MFLKNQFCYWYSSQLGVRVGYLEPSFMLRVRYIVTFLVPILIHCNLSGLVSGAKSEDGFSLCIVLGFSLCIVLDGANIQSLTSPGLNLLIMFKGVK